jgi:hypothetical protein
MDAVVVQALFELGVADGLAPVVIHDAEEASQAKDARRSARQTLIAELLNRVLRRLSERSKRTWAA